MQLMRTVSPRLTSDGNFVGGTRSVAVKFVGDDGRSVSIAFDGRCGWVCDGNVIHETYASYADCPVYSGDTASGPVTDLQSMRILRDALIALNLG
jgi:hypothetical protein